jgi:hypothetical protein
MKTVKIYPLIEKEMHVLEEPFDHVRHLSQHLGFWLPAVPILLYGSEFWTVKIKAWTRIQAVEMKFLRSMKGHSKIK